MEARMSWAVHNAEATSTITVDWNAALAARRGRSKDRAAREANLSRNGVAATAKS